MTVRQRAKQIAAILDSGDYAAIQAICNSEEVFIEEHRGLVWSLRKAQLAKRTTVTTTVVVDDEDVDDADEDESADDYADDVDEVGLEDNKQDDLDDEEIEIED